MRFVLIIISVAWVAWAQTPAAQPAEPPKNAADIAPDAVVAVVNGTKVTADEIKMMIGIMPAPVQKAFANDPQGFMRNYAWYMHVQGLAEKAGLEKQSPYKERLELQRLYTLFQAMGDEAARDVVVTRDEEKAHYDANPGKYVEVQAKLIYIPFSADSAAATDKKVLSEAEAKTKAESIAKQAQEGGDFVELVKAHSQDPGSVAQDGDIGTGVRSNTTHVPEPMRKAILTLKPKQISDPVRHENGYYIFRAESVGVIPYEKVREEIYKDLKHEGFVKWQKKTQAESKLQLTNEEFFRSLAKEVQPK